MKYIVLGLGNFGRALAIDLTKRGHEVIGVDTNMIKVEHLKETITHTVCLDSTDENAMASLPLQDADAVIVAIGEDEGASILTTALLKRMNIKRIIGRVVSNLQRTVLEAMEIPEYIMPEEESADRLALRLDHADIVDSFKVSEQYSIIEAKVPKKYAGKTLREANLTNKYRILVLSTLGNAGIANSDTILHEDDVVVLYGHVQDIQRLIG